MICRTMAFSWMFSGESLTESPILQQFPMPPGSRVICLQKAIAQKSPADFFQSSQRSSKPPPSPTTPPELPDEKVLEPGWIPNPLRYSIDIDIYIMIHNYILIIYYNTIYTINICIYTVNHSNIGHQEP